VEKTPLQKAMRMGYIGEKLPVDQAKVDSSIDRRKFLLVSSFIAVSSSNPQIVTALNLDERQVTVDVSKGSLGLELKEVVYRRSFRVLIKRVLPGSPAAATEGIDEGLILMNVNGQNVEGIPAKEVKKVISNAIKDSPTLTLVLKDPLKFQEMLKDSESTAVGEEITTTITPAIGDIPAQEVKMERSFVPELCSMGAEEGDLLEIEFTGYIANNDGSVGNIFDGSAVKVNGREVSGRGGDSSVYFVLGKQPAGQFPPAWDVGLVGMCVGEKRRLTIPPSLGFGERGIKRRNVPPNATLIYDVKVVSINGLSLMR